MSLKILKFTADWCAPCKTLSKRLKPILEEYKDIELQEVDVEEHDEIATKYHIMKLPAMVFLQDGIECAKLTGTQETEEIIKTIEMYN